MKAKLVIVPIDEYAKIYKKEITTASERYEINNFADKNGITFGLNELVKRGYLIMVTNGYYNKIYLSDICSEYQIMMLSSFLSDNINANFAKIIIHPIDGGKIKEINGNMSIVDIENFIKYNTKDIDNNYRVSNNSYIDDEKEKIIKEGDKNVR